MIVWFLRRPVALHGASSFPCRRLSVAAAALTVRPHAFWSALCHYLWRGWPEEMLFIMWILQWIMCHNCFHSVRQTPQVFRVYFPSVPYCFLGLRQLPGPPPPAILKESDANKINAKLSVFQLNRHSIFLAKHVNSDRLDFQTNGRHTDSSDPKTAQDSFLTLLWVEEGQGSSRSELFMGEVGPLFISCVLSSIRLRCVNIYVPSCFGQ